MTIEKPDLPEMLQKLPKRDAVPFALMATSSLAVASGLMLGFAVPHLIGGGGVINLIKSGLMAGAGALVAYGVNRLAVEKGAPQAAIGMMGAKLVSVASILFVGGGLFTATYAGFTIQQVKELRLREFGAEVASFVDYRARKAVESSRAVPVVQTIVDDLAIKELCEKQSSCLSGSSHVGAGPVTRLLAEKRGRAETIVQQVSDGDAVRRSSIEQLNKLIAGYQDILNDPELDGAERQKRLQLNISKTGQALSALDEAVPTALLLAYANELQSPVSIAGNRDISRKVSALLSGYADSLNTALHSKPADDRDPPRSPGMTGVSDTFSYLGHFLPIAAIVAVVELCFPLSLWLYTYFSYAAHVTRNNPTPVEPAPYAPRRGRPPNASKNILKKEG